MTLDEITTDLKRQLEPLRDCLGFYNNINDDILELIIAKAHNAGELQSVREQLAKRRHVHQNSGDGSDACKKCGLDLRNDVHLRMNEWEASHVA